MRRLALLLLVSFAVAQTGTITNVGGSGNGVSVTTVAGLANVSKVPGTPAVVTDANSSSDCTVGGGATIIICRWGGASWGTFPAGSATAGGSTTQLQYNNATALGGISQWTTNGTTTITGSASGVLDLSAFTLSNFKLPSITANTVYGNCTGAGAAPSACSITSAMVPTLNQNTTGSAAKLTTARNIGGNSFDGSTNTAFANLFIVQGTADAGLSGAQFLGALGTGILKSTTTTGVLSIALAGDFPTLNQNTTGTASNLSGAPALPNGTSATTQAALDNTTKIATTAFVLANAVTNPMTTLGDLATGGASGVPTRLVGPTGTNGVAQVLTSTPSGGAATAEVWAPTGIVPRASTCTANADTIVAADRGGYVSWTDASPCTVTLPQAGTTGFASNFFFLGCNIGAGTSTITPTTSTISYTNGSAYTSGASTLPLSVGQCASIISDNTNYFAIIRSAGTTTTIASGTSALATGAISSATCASVVTTAAVGTATTDVVGWGFNGDPTAVTGYVPATAGMLTIIAYPTSGNVNFKVCNNTTSSITPGAITLNWRITR